MFNNSVFRTRSAPGPLTQLSDVHSEETVMCGSHLTLDSFDSDEISDADFQTPQPAADYISLPTLTPSLSHTEDSLVPPPDTSHFVDVAVRSLTPVPVDEIEPISPGSPTPRPDWTCLAETATVFALKWDPSLLERLGGQIQSIQTNFAVSMAHTWISFTAVGHILSPLSWPIGLISFANDLDNAWAMTMTRAEQASRALAAAIKETKSPFPLSLIGFSMGARVIFYALIHLAREGKLDLVHNVVLAGTPTSHNVKNWRLARSAVTGRLVNAYSRNDWMLAFLYRYNEWQLRVAGIQAVPLSSVENFNVSSIVKSHADYCDKMPELLQFVSFPYVH